MQNKNKYSEIPEKHLITDMIEIKRVLFRNCVLYSTQTEVYSNIILKIF